MSLYKNLIPISFTGGADTKTAEKLVQAGSFLRLENVVRRKTGLLQKRYGFSALGKQISGSTSLIDSGRRLDKFNNDLLLMTDDSLYSYSTASDNWISRGSLISATVASDPVIRNSDVQAMPDMAYLDGLVCCVWADSRGGIGCSVFDDSTGAAVLADYRISTTGSRPKVVGVGHTFLITYYDTSDFRVSRISTATPTVVEDGSAEASLITDNPYDIAVYNDTAVFAYNTASSIRIGYLSPLGTVGSTATLAIRGRNALTVVPDESTGIFYIFYHDSAGTQADKVRVSAYTDDLITVSSGTVESVAAVRNITGAVVGSAVEVFYEVGAASTTYNQYINGNTVVYAGGVLTIGTAVAIRRSVGLAGKAFVYQHDAYFPVAFESTLQSTFFVCRDDGFIVARMQPNVGGGLTRDTARSLKTGLPRVSIDSQGRYIFPVQVRNKLTTETSSTLSGFIGLNKQALEFGSQEFDTDTLGENLHIAGGIVQAYDGARVVEHGFHVFPEDVTFSATVAFTFPSSDVNTGTDVITKTSHGLAEADPISFAGTLPSPLVAGTIYFAKTVTANTFKVAATAGGAAIDLSTTGSGTITVYRRSSSLSAGTYRVCVVYEWIDGQGQIHRSAPSISQSLTTLASQIGSVVVPTLRLTDKSRVKIVVYRTQADGVTVYYRDAEAFNDTTADTVTISLTQSDASLSVKEILYTVGGTLENICPPACTVAHKYKNRLILAGLENGNEFTFSKEYVTAEGVAFSDAFKKRVDPLGGRLTAASTLDDKCVLFKPSAIFMFNGDGPLDTGAQDDYRQPDMISSDVGCENQKSIVITPLGVMFQTPSKGIWLLNRSSGLEYVGAPVERYNSSRITSAIVLDADNEVRFTTEDDVCLVFNYQYNQWSTFSNYEAESAVNDLETYMHLKADGTVNAEVQGQYHDNGQTYKMVIESPWYQFARLQGFQRLYRWALLGDFISHHTTRVKIAYDFEPVYNETVYFNTEDGLGTDTYGSDATYGSSSVYGGTGSQVFQFRSKPRRQKCQSFKMLIEDIDNLTPSGGGSFSLAGLSFEIGNKQGLAKMRGSKTRGS